MITLTELAVTKIKEISEAEDIGHTTVRISVKGGGCAGFVYDMNYDEKGPTDMDNVIEQDGVKIIVDPMSFQYLDGLNIDYIDGLMNAGFKFDNPNSKGSCGCGHSFYVISYDS
jgi:iron-sulfur cluster insertion protein